MKDRSPRQHSQALWLLHNSLHYERLMQQPPVLPGYDLSWEMGTKSHTTIIVPSGWREPALIRELAVPPKPFPSAFFLFYLFCTKTSQFWQPYIVELNLTTE
ncbi:hypothetical protein AVEN_233575-1 [Araneus ventricosus]|uniref:Uncharacterized protein n=1 Tax=Araneus ventricosus TaxID=182803 RepID=A0A4Y2HQ67_ARAVE|nr:hypothetical protein AVEN_233575-1 [Araneus ventricosus]